MTSRRTDADRKEEDLPESRSLIKEGRRGETLRRSSERKKEKRSLTRIADRLSDRNPMKRVENSHGQSEEKQGP